MHYSTNGETWRFVRTFFLEMPETVSVGMQAQSPFSSGCRIEFDYWSIEPGAVADFRSGE
jgi:regulation of enolase protein 1 (concanavalin A-like superfamily)